MTSSQASGSAGGGSATAAAAADMRSVQRSFAIGWHVAQLYHGPIPLAADPSQTAVPSQAAVPQQTDDTHTLPLRAQLGIAARYQMVLDTVDNELGIIGARSASTSGLTAELAAPNPSADSIRSEVTLLHEKLMASLTASDFRLGKAYSLGSALAETVLRPAAAYREAADPTTGAPSNGPAVPAKAFTEALDMMLTPARVQQLTRWLAALKSLLAPHAAYATSRTLEMWSGSDGGAAAVSSAKSARDKNVDQTRAALQSQGRVWRAMLSGEKQPTDLLQESDYIAAAEQLGKRFRTLGLHYIRQYWRAVAVVIGFALILVIVALVSNLTGGAKIAALIATVAAALGITAKSVASAVGKVAAKLEAPLWESEVDESVAIAAARLPTAPPTSADRRGEDTVGRLQPTHSPAASAVPPVPAVPTAPAAPAAPAVNN